MKAHTVAALCLALAMPTGCRAPVEPVAGASARIVFVSNRATRANVFQVFMMDGDGSHVRRLTRDSNNYFLPKFSPDGNHILFYSQNGVNDEIYLMNSAGDGLVNLTNSPGNDLLPVFSPDGRRIVFASDRDGNREIYIMQRDGSGQTRLTHSAATDHSPQWSPDGTRILFYSTTNDLLSAETYTLFSIGADGQDRTQLTPDSAYEHFSAPDDSPSVLDAAPRYSPDGSLITFQSHHQGAGVINLMNADGSHRLNLVYEAGANFAPFFYPDGSQILFRSHRTGDFDLFRTGIQVGAPQVQVTSDNGHTLFGDFSADGSIILYFSDIDETRYEYYHIYSARSDGAGRKKLTEGNFADYFPDYYP